MKSPSETMEYIDFLERFYRGETGLRPSSPRRPTKSIPGLCAPFPSASLPMANRSTFALGATVRSSTWARPNADIPDDLPPDELTLEMAVHIIEERKRGPRSWASTGHRQARLPDEGRFGPYVQLGDVEEVPGKGKRTRKIKPHRAGLLRGMDAETLDFETSMKLLSLPRDLGPHRDDRAGTRHERSIRPLCEVTRQRQPQHSRGQGPL